ncbi:MAG: Veg family protein [Firmicutes bacterium]|nr:Veg family protein [Bacillota bacterium]
MRKSSMSIEEAKRHINGLKGTALKISVNKGRKKINHYNGLIGDVYPSVFTLQITGDKNIQMLSCSYSDLICGDIELAPSIG